MADSQEPSPEELEQIRREAFQITQLAVSYACPILVSRPPADAEAINSASGVIVELEGAHFLFTAAHLLKDTRRLRAVTPDLEWHLAGHERYAAIDPQERKVHIDYGSDVMALRLTAEEAMAPEKAIVRPAKWPPALPEPGEYVFVCGYPAVERLLAAPRYWSFAPACFGGALDSAGSGKFGLRFERSRWRTYKDGTVPKLTMDLGGMSGGPIFSFRGLMLELIGVISQHSPEYDILLAGPLAGAFLDHLLRT